MIFLCSVRTWFPISVRFRPTISLRLAPSSVAGSGDQSFCAARSGRLWESSDALRLAPGRELLGEVDVIESLIV
jgi:hypothetical protein